MKKQNKTTLFKKTVIIAKKTVHFLVYEMWHLGDSSLSKPKALFLNLLKKLILSAKGFFKGELVAKSASLSFYTALAVVPTFALLIAIGRGFGISEKVDNFISETFSAQSELVPYISQFVNNYLEQAKGGIFIGIGLIFLLWTVISTFQVVEKNFNTIWNVEKSRSFFRQFTTYITLMVLVPVLISLSSGFSIYINNQMSSVLGEFYSPFYNFTIRILPYFFYWLLFTLLYFIVPNTKVKFLHALFAGIIVGSVFQLFQYLYINGQINLSKYNTVYGTFAAVPLFFFWLQISWIIVLYGAELAFVSQNLKDKYYEYDKDKISRRFFDYVLILVTKTAVMKFYENEPPVSAEFISKKYNVPIRLINDAVKQLVEINILTEIIAENGMRSYQPALDINRLSVGMLLDRVEKAGNENFGVKHDSTYSKIWGKIKDIKDDINLKGNDLLIKDL